MKKTGKMLAGVSAAIVGFSLSGCGNNNEMANLPKDVQPDTSSCEDWEWDDSEEVYKCEDRRSSNFGMYYFAGRYFNSVSALRGNQSYKTYKSSSTSTPIKAPSKITNGKSGFGSGSVGGFGG